jgi:hypothetical protein
MKSFWIKNTEVLINDEDFEKVIRQTWYVDSNGYVRHKDRKWAESLHRFVLGVDGPLGCEIDHINGNPADNRKANLRFVQHWQNMHNRSIQTNNTSGYRGVSWSMVQCRWHANIWINKKRIHLGYFSHIEDAAKAYNEAATKNLGVFAKLNKVQP